ncbi:NADP-dependent oxidoreductase [Scytonema sp. NUACC26]|uniref:NADP-dependent oxidoreductase n=1 Tax=Scytonema sp. NUACC26 TaxID=3140176 RepID=UPI0034DBD68E
MAINRSIVLTEYANGVNPTEKNFKLQSCDIPTPQQGEVLLKTLYLSVDPYMRGCMTGIEGYYYPQFPLGQPIVSNGVAKVIESKHSLFQPGDLVEGLIAWQDFSVSDGLGELSEGKGLRQVNPNIKKLSHAVGILGMPGMNAYFGMVEVARLKRGETVLISGAAGAIGSAAGQIAKLLGARVIGLAGSEEKIQMLQRDLGFDLALNYKSKQLVEEISAACPNGPDVYFDNVGGQTSQTVMWTMHHPARIIECGQISTYDDPDGGWLVNIWPIHMNQLRLESFVGYSYAEFFPAGIAQMAYWINQGKLKLLETEIEGLENAPQAFLGLFRGANVGKMLVKVGDEV